ncbi:uncharacterized protein Tco025E_09481, partial [Trypanosoma conorhini]
MLTAAVGPSAAAAAAVWGRAVLKSLFCRCADAPLRCLPFFSATSPPTHAQKERDQTLLFAAVCFEGFEVTATHTTVTAWADPSQGGKGKSERTEEPNMPRRLFFSAVLLIFFMC